MEIRRGQQYLTTFAAVAAFVLAACGANETVLKSGRETPVPAATVESPKSSFDQDIQAMRDADFRFIWVLKRKDGGVIDAADKAVIRTNTEGMNRRVLTDGDKALIVGTNALPFKENIDALFRYFAVKDLSPEPLPKVIPTRPKGSPTPGVQR